MTAEDIDRDFAPIDLADPILDLLIRGVGRREVAARLGVPLLEVHRYVADAVRNRAGESGTHREAVALLHLGLDDVTARAYAALDDNPVASDRAALLEVLLGTQRLRAGLLTASQRKTTDG